MQLQIKNTKTVDSTRAKALPIAKYKFAIASAALFTICCLFSIIQQAHAEGIVKWKDEKGVTHYGDKIPPQYSNTENSVINKQGITVKRNMPVTYKDEAVSQAKIEQDKKDKALLNAFTNEDEIDLARDRNLQSDKVALDGLTLRKANTEKRLVSSQKYAQSFTNKKKPVPADVTNDLKSNQAEMAKIDQQIADHKALMEATRQRFDADKQRYIALRNYANGTGPAPSPVTPLPPPATLQPVNPPASAVQTPTNLPPPSPIAVKSVSPAPTSAVKPK